MCDGRDEREGGTTGKKCARKEEKLIKENAEEKVKRKEKWEARRKCRNVGKGGKHTRVDFGARGIGKEDEDGT